MSADYEIRIAGEMHPGWSQWFSNLEISAALSDQGSPVTTIRCRCIDQAKLRGVLNAIWDLNLEILSLRREFAPSSLERKSSEELHDRGTESQAETGVE